MVWLEGEGGGSAECPAHAAVVAIPGPGEGDAQGLKLLGMAGARGIKALAYGAGLSRWSVAQRCRALLLGAAVLLDSGDPQFQKALAREIGSILAERANAIARRSALQARFAEAGIVAESPAMLKLLAMVLRLAQLSDVPVLISGESGTGKELLARAIHRLDPRRSGGPLVAVNCAAISQALAESELFGHRRGSFTGAERERKGLIRAAHAGVLFLDEISELHPELQAKMLRVLQDGRIIAVGDETEEPVDVRVVAASNRDLGAMVDEGRFRADLYHRLNVVPVRIPPLRERPEDIEPLIRHFARKHSNLASAPCAAGPEFLEALRDLELPGNARQLENIVRQALVKKTDGSPLGLEDLPADVWLQVCRKSSQGREAGAGAGDEAAAPSVLGILSSHGWNLSASLNQCEREMIRAALARAQGNQTRAARLLGVTPRSIYNKLHRPG
jgi:transcriptional regulator with PAS, ATPase and Fis domain